jgi:predicted ATPase with chaperone activity
MKHQQDKTAMERLNFSARAYDRIWKVYAKPLLNDANLP